MPDHAHATLNPAVTPVVHDHGIVFFDRARGRLLTANPVGAFIWQALQLRWSMGAIADEIARRYGVDGATTRADAAAFIAALSAEHLAHVEPES